MEQLGLIAPTANLPQRIDAVLTIDHIAVPATWAIVSADRHIAEADGARISDHDAYVVEVVPPTGGAGS
jgi:hypothetical protein